jgi:L-threonylcarbamoyladenylate synthase
MRIFAAKGRPSFHPLIVHLASADQLGEWAVDVPDVAWRVAERFWPGPLTMILRKRDRVPGVVTGDLPTVGLRVPSHPVAQEVLKQFGGGIAAPSANRFGRLSPTTAEHVRAELGDSVDLIIDGGTCDVGLESTIVDLSSDQPSILRPGAVTAEQLRELIPQLVDSATEQAPHCSGRLLSHYAPRAEVKLVSAAALADEVREAREDQARVAVLAPEERTPLNNVAWYCMPDDPAAYARELYATLRRADETRASRILVVLPPELGVGVAIADRLRKAAAPRDDVK